MKSFYSSVLTVALALALAGCKKEASPETAPAPATGSAPPPKALRLAFVPNNAATFWTIAKAGCAEAQKSLSNVEVDFRIPSSGAAAEQQQILEDLLARGVEGVAVSPIDPANQTALLDKVASQAVLVTQDSDAPASKRVCYIGTDNQSAGVEAGKLIKEALPQGGKIVLFVGGMDAQNAKDRAAGIRQEIAGSSIEILDIRTDETDPSRAQRNAEDTLVKHPDVACLVGLYNYNGPAILNAVRSANKAGQVKIVCFDENDETLAGVASGDIYGTVVQQPFEFGKQAITRMAQAARGDKSAFPAGGKLIIPTLSLKKDTVGAFQARLKKLLGT
ncbi:MAG TPA: sugar-binding protein [Verrucomicrobiae bacterium]|jgi:ribose transport system substrate-binding protein|nr:sugar-binding protein [Verrucomicrobiae bacterium]